MYALFKRAANVLVKEIITCLSNATNCPEYVCFSITRAFTQRMIGMGSVPVSFACTLKKAQKISTLFKVEYEEVSSMKVKPKNDCFH